MKQQLASVSLKSFMVKALLDSGICDCHFDATQNTSVPSGALSINTVSSAARDIDLKMLRNGCDFDSSNNIIVKVGKEVEDSQGLRVDSVKVSHIKKTGTKDLYFGNLIVGFDNNRQVRSLRPISIPLLFSVDSNLGTDTARPIRACWGYDSKKGEKKPCYTIDEQALDGRTLVGCGGTSDVDKEQTTALGFGAGASNNARGGTFVGFEAGKANAGGIGNTIMGYQSGLANTTGFQNTMMGYQAGWSNITGKSNVFIGYHAGKSNTNGAQNHFIGSKAGLNNSTGSDNIFIGYEAGSNNYSGYQNVFIGNLSGKNTTAERNIFIGHQSGEANTIGSENVFLGYRAGSSNTAGKDNVFVGTRSGERNTSGIFNTFVGYTSGVSNTSASRNTFIGYSTGNANTRGEDNTFVGYNSGLKNTVGKENTFIGSEAGSNNLSGQKNVLMGYRSGHVGTGGSHNTFIGYEAGYNNRGYGNTFMGNQAGKENWGGSGNVFIGKHSGIQIVSGSRNVFIGARAGTSLNNSTNDKFVVGNEAVSEWLTGDITSSGNLYVNGRAVLVTSSRALKKNITPFTDFQGALEDLLNTPLFTYQYKNKQDHPEKDRMGIISEELPEHLQIQVEGQLSHPDWPSIYGSFWAGIRALYEILESLRRDFLLNVKNLKFSFEEFKNKQKKLIKDLFYVRRELSDTDKKIDQVYREIADTRREILITRDSFQQQLDEIVKQFPMTEDK